MFLWLWPIALDCLFSFLHIGNVGANRACTRPRTVCNSANSKMYLQSVENYNIDVVFILTKRKSSPSPFRFVSCDIGEHYRVYVVKHSWKQTARTIYCTHDSQYVWRSVREQNISTYKVLSVHALLSTQRIFVLVSYLSLAQTCYELYCVLQTSSAFYISGNQLFQDPRRWPCLYQSTFKSQEILLGSGAPKKERKALNTSQKLFISCYILDTTNIQHFGIIWRAVI
jgi:hypothetical protein